MVVILPYFTKPTVFKTEFPEILSQCLDNIAVFFCIAFFKVIRKKTARQTNLFHLLLLIFTHTDIAIFGAITGIHWKLEKIML